jgi:hypothetical protein
MHSDTWCSRAITCGDGGPDTAPPPGSRCLQDLWANWNAGALVLTPEFAAIESAPEELGSGKFDTPWARMQPENATLRE